MIRVNSHSSAPNYDLSESIYAVPNVYEYATWGPNEEMVPVTWSDITVIVWSNCLQKYFLWQNVSHLTILFVIYEDNMLAFHAGWQFWTVLFSPGQSIDIIFKSPGKGMLWMALCRDNHVHNHINSRTNKKIFMATWRSTVSQPLGRVNSICK